MATINRQIHLVSRPSGEADAGSFRLGRAAARRAGRRPGAGAPPLPQPRSRTCAAAMNDAKSYAQPQPLDAGDAGRHGRRGRRIEASRAIAGATSVVGMGGWQEYAIVDAGSVRRRCARSTRRTFRCRAYLGAVGMPGVTAWYGLMQDLRAQGRARRSSSARRAARSAARVGQLAKARGCRAVGIAGGADKCRYVVDELGFDACVDYKAHADPKAL